MRIYIYDYTKLYMMYIYIYVCIYIYVYIYMYVYPAHMFQGWWLGQNVKSESVAGATQAPDSKFEGNKGGQ